jgi:hypothetical protein
MSEQLNEDTNHENYSATQESNSTLSNQEDNSNIFPQSDMSKSCSCGNKAINEIDNNMTSSFIYTLGRIEPRFSSIGIEKEFNQAAKTLETKGQTEYEVLKTVLEQKQFRYLARQMCWILKVEGLDTYILSPREPEDFESLIESIRVPPRATDVDVVIGFRGLVSSPNMCGGLILPIVTFDQVYSFDTDSLIKSIPKPKEADAKRFNATAEEIFNRISQMADNVGATDTHRALNYLLVRYEAIYVNAVTMHGLNYSLSGVEVRPSILSNTRKIVNVIFSYRNRNTDVEEKYAVSVDVTEEYPFLINKLTQYFDH